MKKIFVLIMIFCAIFFTGCGKNNSESIFKDLTDKVNGLSAYKLEGQLDVKNENNSYSYDVSVSYMQKDKFRVSLINNSNNHEQVILRNDDGVFVLTPSLNKSFKFQSDWPYNNSQIYLLGSIIDDLNNDKELTKALENGKYVYTSSVTYPNNSNLTKQKVIVSSDLSIEKVEVLNGNGEVEMTFTIKNIDYAPTFDESYFEVNSIINTNTSNQNSKPANTNDKTSENSSVENQTDENTTNSSESENNNQGTTEPTATIDDIIYPLYLPSGTVLEEQEKVSKTDGERVILTFGGEKSFTLVEETISREEEFTIIPTYGEPHQVNDTIGAITDNSLNWISGDIEYYLVSDVMNSQELLEIANSIDVSSVASLK